MNQPHHPDAELDALAVEFGTVLHSFSAQDPVQHHLSERMTTVVDLAARLGSKIHDAHYALATCSPADRSSHAATATELCHAVGAADRYGNPDADTAFARTRIAAALTTARANLTEASGYLRHLTHTEPRRRTTPARRPRPQPPGGHHRHRPRRHIPRQLQHAATAEPGAQALMHRPSASQPRPDTRHPSQGRPTHHQLPEERTMTSITEALALYDTANQIDRLNFQLRALDRDPAIPSVSEVSFYVHTLAAITLSVSDQVKHRLTEGGFDGDGKKTVEAYSAVLPPLSEAMTELGRAQAEIAYFNFTTHPAHRDNPSGLDHSRRQANEIITGCCEAADEILEAAADDLRTAAGRLAPSPTHAQATARSPHASLFGQSAPMPATPPAPAPSTVAPTAAKGR